MTRTEFDARYAGYVGIDEAGRGCAAGSLIFVGVKLRDTAKIEDINWAYDSKKTKHKQRVEMAKALKPFVEYFVVETNSNEIDKYGLSYCISRSLERIKEFFNAPIIYDGNTSYKVSGIETLIKGDDKVSLISVASIFAKLLKDKNSEKIHSEYPEYGFDSHSGYINEHHTNMIIEHGYCPYHRKSYNIKKLQGLLIKDNIR